MPTKEELEKRVADLERELQESSEQIELAEHFAELGVKKTGMMTAAIVLLFTMQSALAALGFQSVLTGPAAWALVALGTIVLVGFVSQVLAFSKRSGKISGQVSKTGLKVEAQVGDRKK